MDDAIAKLLRHLPRLQDGSVEWATIKSPPGEFLYVEYSREALDVLDALGHAGLLTVFDWQSWSADAEAFLQHVDRIALADLGTLRKLVTAIVRADRFSEGTLLRGFETGAIRAIVERLQFLSASSRERRE
ncbi:MAG: DUF6508 domain-containing protein [Acidobacteriota bacterium]